MRYNVTTTHQHESADSTHDSTYFAQHALPIAYPPTPAPLPPPPARADERR